MRPVTGPDVAVALAVIGLLSLLVVPIGARLLDALLLFNFGLALVVLVMSTTVRSPLEMSAFPGILLFMTLLRLCLNVSSTRLVLGQGADFEGHVIRAFGTFVAQDNIGLGLVVFSMLVMVQYLVITRGAERIAEVSARFHLEALPPHLLSIESELSSGRITPQEATERRLRLERQSELCGAMDGVSRFLKGETLASILIVAINLLGGTIGGMVRNQGAGIVQVFSTFALLTIGDGLAQMLPSIATSWAAGILTTKAQTGESFSRGALLQLGAQRSTLALVSAFLATGVLGLAVMGGAPSVWALVATTTLLALAYHFQRPVARRAHGGDGGETPDATTAPAAGPVPADVARAAPPLTLRLSPWAARALDDPAAGSGPLERLRQSAWEEIGLAVPPWRVESDPALPDGAYALVVGGMEVGRGHLVPGAVLWLLTADDVPPGATRATHDPRPPWLRPGPAVWIPQDATTPEAGQPLAAAEVLCRQLRDLLVDHADDLIGIDGLRRSLDGLREHYPAAVAEVEKTGLSLPLVAEVVAALIKEHVSARNLARILTVLCARRPAAGSEPRPLVEAVRVALGATICRPLADATGTVRAMLVDPVLETEMARSIDASGTPAMDPARLRDLVASIARMGTRMVQAGYPPVLAVQSRVRWEIKRLTAKAAPDLTVVAFAEVPPSLQLLSAGIVGRAVPEAIPRPASVRPTRQTAAAGPLA